MTFLDEKDGRYLMQVSLYCLGSALRGRLLDKCCFALEYLSVGDIATRIVRVFVANLIWGTNKYAANSICCYVIELNSKELEQHSETEVWSYLRFILTT